MLASSDDVSWSAFEVQPGEITREAAHQRLDERQRHDQQTRVHGIELRLDARAHHVGKRHAKCAAKHEIRNNSECRQKNSQAEEKDRQREPFDAAEISGDFRDRCRINRLEKTFAKNPVINNRPIDEPNETRRAVNLPAPFRRASRPEENQMLETQKRFRFAVTFLLFKKSAQRETPVMP